MDKYEFGYQFDCEANGCSPHHEDEKRIFPLYFWGLNPTKDRSPMVNGHRTRWMKRKIMEWEPLDGT